MKHFEMVKVQVPKGSDGILRLNVENLRKLSECGFQLAKELKSTIKLRTQK